MTEPFETNFYNPGEIEPRWQKSGKPMVFTIPI